MQTYAPHANIILYIHRSTWSCMVSIYVYMPCKPTWPACIMRQPTGMPVALKFSVLLSICYTIHNGYCITDRDKEMSKQLISWLPCHMLAFNYYAWQHAVLIGSNSYSCSYSYSCCVCTWIMGRSDHRDIHRLARSGRQCPRMQCIVYSGSMHITRSLKMLKASCSAYELLI